MSEKEENHRTRNKTKRINIIWLSTRVHTVCDGAAASIYALHLRNEHAL